MNPLPVRAVRADIKHSFMVPLYNKRRMAVKTGRSHDNFSLGETLSDVTGWINTADQNVRQFLSPLDTPFVNSIKNALTQYGYKVPDNPQDIVNLYNQITRERTSVAPPQLPTRAESISEQLGLGDNPILLYGIVGVILLLVVLAFVK